jgi:hypothetical protein
MSIEQQLRRAYDRAAAAEPDQTGAYDRFLHRRTRHDRAVAIATSLVLVVVLALAALVPRVLAGHQQVADRPLPLPDRPQPLPERPRTLPKGLIARPDHGFAVRVPDGWKVSRTNDPVGLVLVPTRSSTAKRDTAVSSPRIWLQTRVLDPRLYPGRPGSPQELQVPAPFGAGSIPHSAPQGPFTKGSRADGRQFIRSNRSDAIADSPWSQDYWLAWPYQCAVGTRCPPAARYRALLVSAASPRRDRQATQTVLRQVVETVRPIGSAAGGAEPVAARRACRIPSPNQFPPLDVQVQTIGTQARDAQEVALTVQLQTTDFVPCRLRQRITLELREGGRLAKVQGNPSTVEFDGGLPEGSGGSGSFGAGWRWRNWCGSRNVSLHYVGLKGRNQSPSGMRPRCLDPAKPSTVELVYVRG